MVEQQVLDPTQTKWAAPVLFEQNKNEIIRFCVNNQKIKTVWKRFLYPVPQTDEFFDYLDWAVFGSTPDAISGYSQLLTLDSDRDKTKIHDPQWGGIFAFYLDYRMPIVASRKR